MSKQRKGPGIRARLAAALPERPDLPTGLFGNTPYLTLRGQEELELCGCAGLLRYESGCIALALRGGGSLTLTGENLCLREYGGRVLLVRGRIDRLEFAV